MMKRPRSFISTLFIFFCLATVSLGLTTYSRPAQASSLPRLMDPRAGDPTEPSDGPIDAGNGIVAPGDLEPVEAQAPHTSGIRGLSGWVLQSFAHAWSRFLLVAEGR